MGNKAFLKGVSISIGVVQATGDLFTPKVSNAGKAAATKNICPVCTGASPVSQFYQCDVDPTHTNFTTGDCHKGKEVSEGLIRLDAAALADARGASLPPGQLELNVHKLEDIESKTIASGTMYVFSPTTGGSRNAGIIVDLLTKRPDLVLMGMVNFRGQEKLMRVSPGLNGQLMLTEMLWPEDMEHFEELDYEYKPSLLDAAEQFVESAVVDFDANSYKSAARERVAALVEAEASGNVIPMRPVVSDDDDLEAQLLAALAS